LQHINYAFSRGAFQFLPNLAHLLFNIAYILFPGTPPLSFSIPVTNSQNSDATKKRNKEHQEKSNILPEANDKEREFNRKRIKH